MQINEKIKEVLKEYNILISDGLAYLTNVYFDCVPSYIPKDIVQKIQRTKIIVAENGTYKWNIPLFEDQITGFEWVEEWRNGFSKINPDRKGTKQFVMSRMKKFFIMFPDIRKEEVEEATKMYLKSVNSPMYLKKAHKFITEGSGLERNSELKEWVDRYREKAGNSEGRVSTSITMK